ncbi:protein LONGIFOLIA 1 [Gossypium australe]|uniref:Protein LONGIFOLIA 1 n=1 Tax=Gossypium australe TaxID=47621 RepID=A0A5B6VPZ2_9ROSI|nr:protein LONGIFOLIA 1 [Gossypium australe]
MMAGIVQEQNIEKKIDEKQKGCMAGFFQIFDCHHILAGKRLYTVKRLPSTTSREMTSEQVKNVESPLAISKIIEKLPSPEPSIAMGSQNKSPRGGPIFEFNEDGASSPWKFSKEAPRLSLDSRAVVNATGSLKPREIRTNIAILPSNQCESNREEDGVDGIDRQRRSPSVVARLMGLEAPLPDSDPEPHKRAELRRSTSEARGRDLFQYRFIDRINFHLNGGISSNVVTKNGAEQDEVIRNGTEGSSTVRREPVKTSVRGTVQTKRFYNSVDFFPKTKQTVSINGEIEKELKLRGIDEPSKDLENLKRILEALQLKGLLQTTKPPNQRNKRSFVYEQSPIVVIRPERSSPIRRSSNDSPPPAYRSKNGASRNSKLEPPPPSPRRDRPDTGRNLRNQSRISGIRSPSRRPLRIETQRGNGNVEQRRMSPVQSARVNVRRTELDQANRSAGNRKSTAEKVFIPAEDETSTVSESSASSSSQTDAEKSKVEEYKEGRSLLERFDKLLNSIAKMNAAQTELQPSPVSVLDASFYKDDSSPSPVMKRRMDFKDQVVESEDELWSPASAMSTAESKSSDKSDDCDFNYISDILKASNYLPDDTDVFLLLEKQQNLKGKDTSKVYKLQRKLIFDTINEILNGKGELPPWKLKYPWSGETSLQQIWSEFERIRRRDSADDLFEVICGVLRKDLAGDAINGWGDYPIEMSEAVLYIERQIFKDLIVETIQDLIGFSGKSNEVPTSRRKLVF